MRTPRSRHTAFLVASILDAAMAGADRQTWQRRRWATKPLLMPLLIASRAGVDPQSPHRALRVAQMASCAGDVLLLRDHDDRWFQAGVSSFAVAHLAYTAALLPHVPFDPPARRAAGAVAVVSGVSASRLHRDARRVRPDLAGAVAAYSLVIGSMAAAAAAVSTRRDGGRALRAGALLFLTSDSLIGATTFTLPEAPRRLETLVMVTYTAGQLLLDRGITDLTRPSAGQGSGTSMR